MGSRSNLAPPQGAAAPPPSSPMPAAPAQPGPNPDSVGANANPAELRMPMVASGAVKPEDMVQTGAMALGFGGGGMPGGFSMPVPPGFGSGMPGNIGPDGGVQFGAGAAQSPAATGINAKCPTCGK